MTKDGDESEKTTRGVSDVSRDDVEVTVRYFEDAHDGPGWYWWESEYPDEGCTGAFATRAEAARHALKSCPEYVVSE